MPCESLTEALAILNMLTFHPFYTIYVPFKTLQASRYILHSCVFIHKYTQTRMKLSDLLNPD